MRSTALFVSVTLSLCLTLSQGVEGQRTKGKVSQLSKLRDHLHIAIKVLRVWAKVKVKL